MTTIPLTARPREIGPHLACYQPTGPDRNEARWRINGHPASILIWTEDEWERLDPRPGDAQFYPCGVWCALRVD